MGGDGGAGQQSYQAGNFAMGQSAAQQGIPLSALDENHPEYQYALAGYNQYTDSQNQMDMMMSMMQGGQEAGGYDYAGAQAEADAAYQAQLLEQQQAAGMASVADLYGQYLDAAGSATDFVNTQIEEESSNAALLGVEYNIDQKQKDQRISDYFATIWGAGSQSELEGLIDLWGAPEGFEGFPIMRGEGGNAKPGGTETATTSGGMKPKGTMATSEDDTLSGAKQTSILGA